MKSGKKLHGLLTHLYHASRLMHLEISLFGFDFIIPRKPGERSGLKSKKNARKAILLVKEQNNPLQIEKHREPSCCSPYLSSKEKRVRKGRIESNASSGMRNENRKPS
jgi:hypothetical protein